MLITGTQAGIEPLKILTKNYKIMFSQQSEDAQKRSKFYFRQIVRK